MRILTWNMNHAARRPEVRTQGWARLRESWQPDVALLQEAVVPKGVRATSREPAVPGVAWRTYVACFRDGLEVRERNVPGTKPGWTAVADVHGLGDRPLTVVAFHAPKQPDYHGAVRELFRAIEPHRTEWLAGDCIVGGDWNVGPMGTPQETKEAARLMRDLEAMGFVNLVARGAAARTRWAECQCGEPASCWHTPTFRSPRYGDFAIDHLFGSPALAERLDSCATLPEAEREGLSDHWPLLATFR